MATSAFFKVDDFVEQVIKGQHDFGNDTFKVVLTNTDPAAAAVLTDVTQISANGGYTTGVDGGFALSNVTVVESNGTVTVDADPAVFTATGTTDAFRYAVIYNTTPDTGTSVTGRTAYSVTDPLVGYYDYGSSITLSNTETFTVNFTTSIFTLA